MKNGPGSNFPDRKENQEELNVLVFKGNCPYCNSQKVSYREDLAHQKFGFKCHQCQWKGKYKLKDFEELAQNYYYISKSKREREKVGG